MLFDRRPFYAIAAGVALLAVAALYFLVPRVSPEQRVREQLALLVQDPWTQVLIDRVELRGGEVAAEALLHGVRLDTNTPVRIQFIGDSPYTAESAMKYLSDHALDGATADVLMVPRSMTWEPYRSQFAAATTHVGVAVFAGLAESAASDALPAATSSDMSIESPSAPPAPEPEPEPAPATESAVAPPPHG